ncbi:hypothetical protein ACHRVW_22770 [Flavobacterium collinsii]|uniref:hypothetical protein n=1 Tax=Flavobacterium collinsii TaxID=1114861 RepID=UPI0022CB6500|nr:hypothetical protein [Flavobacterium collinsii]GIQ57147.1 hypothetical protein Flavo103_02830 [Flavobacterium collinsii]
MDYNYNTPEEAIISLENAYTNMDLINVIASKDFETEAKIILFRSNVELNKETIKETAKLLELSLIEHIENNGFPDFSNVDRKFSNLKEIDDNLFFIEETLTYDNGKAYTNTVFVTVEDKKWKVVMTEEK